jgi:acyl carrier protein
MKAKENLLLKISRACDIDKISALVNQFESKPLTETEAIVPSISGGGYDGDLKARLFSIIQSIFATQLSLPLTEIDVLKELSQYRIPSLKIVEITVQLIDEFGDLPTTLLFEKRNINGIIGFLVSEKKEALEKKYNITPSKAVQRLEDNILTEKNLSCYHLSDTSMDDEIAIIGINGCYAQSDNISQFWENLKNGKNCVTEVPPSRWDVNEFYATSKECNKTYSKWGGFINNVANFDAAFFHISPREAEMMDPQQRKFLEIVYGLIEDAGYSKKTLDKKTGVFVGVVTSDYLIYSHEASLNNASVYPWSDLYQIPNRVSYHFDLVGPSYSINAACSSSGYALYNAYESIRRKECNQAIVGGVNLILSPVRFVQYAQMQMLAQGNACRAFGGDATCCVVETFRSGHKRPRQYLWNYQGYCC